MPDYSQMSDQELMSKLGNVRAQQPQKTSSSNDVSSMSDEDLLSAIGSSSTNQPQVEAPSDEPSPLNFKQNLIMGFAPNDKVRMEYLAEKFQGANIAQTEDGSITINGARINPEGFDFGDILRNAGYAMPLAGQMVAGTAGALGGMPTGPGAVASGMAAGAGGAMAGETVRVTSGRAMGLPTTGQDALKSISTEGLIAGAGEGIFRGALLGATKSGITNQIANVWRGVANRFKDATPDILRFVGGVDKDAVKTGQKYGWNELLQPKYFEEQRTSKIAKNLILGDENIPIERLDVTAGPNITIGHKMLADSMKSVDNPSFDKLVTTYAKNLSPDTVGLMKSEGSSLMRPEYFADDAPFKVARNIVDQSDKALSKLGNELYAVEEEALRNKGRLPFVTDDIGNDIKRFLSQRAGSIKVQGTNPNALPNSPGIVALNKMKRLLGSTLKQSESDIAAGKPARFALYGETRPDGSIVNHLSGNQAAKIRRSLDEIVHGVANNKNISGDIKVKVFEAAKKYRERLHNYLGTGEISKRYSSMMNFVTDAKVDEKYLNSLESTIKNFNSQNEAVKQGVDQLLQELPQGRGISNAISHISAAKEIQKVNVTDILEKVAGSLNQEDFMRGGVGSFKEEFLQSVDNALGVGNSNAKKRMFISEAEKSLAAKKFLAGSPQLLRIQTLSNMLGMGALGFSSGGPVGAATGGIAALTLSQPQNLGKIMKILEKKSMGRNTQRSMLTDMIRLSRQATIPLGTRSLSATVDSQPQLEESQAG